MNKGLESLLEKRDARQSMEERRAVATQLFDYLLKDVPTYLGLSAINLNLEFVSPEELKKRVNSATDSSLGAYLHSTRTTLLCDKVLADEYYLTSLFPFAALHEIGHGIDEKYNSYPLKHVGPTVYGGQPQTKFRHVTVDPNRLCREAIANVIAAAYLQEVPIAVDLREKEEMIYTAALYAAHGINSLPEYLRPRIIRRLIFAQGIEPKRKEIINLTVRGFKAIFPKN
jgi:hypothetical protein